MVRVSSLKRPATVEVAVAVAVDLAMRVVSEGIRNFRCCCMGRSAGVGLFPAAGADRRGYRRRHPHAELLAWQFLEKGKDCQRCVGAFGKYTHSLAEAEREWLIRPDAGFEYNTM